MSSINSSTKNDNNPYSFCSRIQSDLLFSCQELVCDQGYGINALFTIRWDTAACGKTTFVYEHHGRMLIFLKLLSAGMVHFKQSLFKQRQFIYIYICSDGGNYNDLLKEHVKPIYPNDQFILTQTSTQTLRISEVFAAF